MGISEQGSAVGHRSDVGGQLRSDGLLGGIVCYAKCFVLFRHLCWLEVGECIAVGTPSPALIVGRAPRLAYSAYLAFAIRKSLVSALSPLCSGKSARRGEVLVGAHDQQVRKPAEFGKARRTKSGLRIHTRMRCD